LLASEVLLLLLVPTPSIKLESNVRKKSYVIVRGEATNVFNLVSLGNPGLSGPPATDGQAPSSTSFGQITGASSPRIMQIGARLTF
jgi:hypothetical protein